MSGTPSLGTKKRRLRPDVGGACHQLHCGLGCHLHLRWAHLAGGLGSFPQARLYSSDDSPTYAALIYTPGIHIPMPNKSQTYRVEGDNAELRHYLARLARRSRCFSRCLKALWRAVKLFVYAWNRRQLYKRQYPDYPAHVMEFVYP